MKKAERWGAFNQRTIIKGVNNRGALGVKERSHNNHVAGDQRGKRDDDRGQKSETAESKEESNQTKDDGKGQATSQRYTSQTITRILNLPLISFLPRPSQRPQDRTGQQPNGSSQSGARHPRRTNHRSRKREIRVGERLHLSDHRGRRGRIGDGYRYGHWDRYPR